MKRLRQPLALLLLSLLLASSISVAAAPSSGPTRQIELGVSASGYTTGTVECEFLSILNAHRASIGRSAVKLSRTLGAAAMHHSLDMAATGVFDASHNLSDGTTARQNIANHGYPLREPNTSGPGTPYYGEIIAAGYETAQAVFNGWYNSSGHRNIMESANFKAVGIDRATASGQRYTYYWTGTFGGLEDQTINCDGTSNPPTPAPTAGARTRYPIVTGGRTSNSTTSRYAFDNDTSTAWRTVGGTRPTYAYVWFDFGSSKNIGQLRWKFSKVSYADSYRIQVSNDRVNWTTISNRSNPAATNTWEYKTWAGKARYVRIYFSNPNRDTYLGYVMEFQAYSPSP